MAAKKTAITLYWKCQLLGWTLAALFWSYQAYFMGQFSFLIAGIHLFTDVLIGVSLTHSYRWFIQKRNGLDQPIRQMTWKIVIALGVLSFSYMLLVVIKNYEMKVLFNSAYTLPFYTYFKISGVTLLATGLRLMAIWVLLYHLYHYAQREIRITQENAQLQLMTKDAQLSNLQAQLNPHFLFNSLNSIKALTLEEPHTARRGVDLLSELLRKALFKGAHRLLPIAAEMELVQDYLELETLRFEERLQVKYQVDQAAVNKLIPAFSIQCLVENAIKHGIDKSKEGGLIHINVMLDAQQIIITVSNTGKLQYTSEYPGLGLKNLSERLKLQFGELASLKLIQQQPNTVLATLILPCHG